eukprot:354908-Chlamydomonas_euryale.AAC.5
MSVFRPYLVSPRSASTPVTCDVACGAGSVQRRCRSAWCVIQGGLKGSLGSPEKAVWAGRGHALTLRPPSRLRLAALRAHL